MSEVAHTIVTIDGVEVARTEALDTGRPHNANPRLSIVHDESVPWTEVIAQTHPSPSGPERRSVHEKFIEWNDQRMIVLGRYDPGFILERHGHSSDHVIYVLEGVLMVGEYHCPRGTLIVLEEGAAFGPLYADKPGYHAVLASKGIVRLPNPTFVSPPSAPAGFGTPDDRWS
jgi:quercetin dioxygenase-like cupin family protein